MTDYCCEAAAYLARVRAQQRKRSRASYWRKRGDNTPDPVAVDRACDRDKSVPLTREEVAAAFAVLDGRGCSAREIAEVIGVSERTVTRWRADRARLPRGRTGLPDADEPAGPQQEDECARGGQTPGAAPLIPLRQEWHVP